MNDTENDKLSPAPDTPAEGATPATDNNTQSGIQQSDAAQETTNKDATRAAAGDPPHTPGRGGRGLAVLALVLALVAAGGAGYALYQIEWVQKLARVEQNAALNRQFDALTATVKQLAEQDARLQQAQQTLLQNDEGLKNRQLGLDKQQQTLADSLEKLYAQLNRTLDSWALEEIEQLLRIANHSLVLNKDVNTAVAGLELADRRLNDLGDPGLLPVRRQIANDVAALKVVPRVDVSGIALRLASMRDTVGKLPLQEQPQRDLSAKPAQTAAVSDSSWLASTKELLSDTLGVIRIQNISKPVRPLLTPEQRHFLQGNLRLMLGGAQLAALHGDNTTYNDNLKQAQQWLGEYFDQNDERVKKSIDTLSDLVKIELDPQLPDISGSLSALDAAKQKLINTERKGE